MVLYREVSVKAVGLNVRLSPVQVSAASSIDARADRAHIITGGWLATTSPVAGDRDCVTHPALPERITRISSQRASTARA
jgi:hypothetical protein